MARRKEADCNGCRRAFAGCTCKPWTNLESEEPDMNKLRLIRTDTREIKNVVFPAVRPCGLWQRITRLLAKAFQVF